MNDPTTPEGREALRALLAAGSPPPWHAEADGGPHRGRILVREGSDYGAEEVAAAYCGAHIGHGAANARLIAAAVNALPALLDHADAQDRLVASLRADYAYLSADHAEAWAEVNRITAEIGVLRADLARVRAADDETIRALADDYARARDLLDAALARRSAAKGAAEAREDGDGW